MTFEGAGRCIYLSIYSVLVFGYFRQKCFWLVLSIYLQYQTVHLSSHKNGHIICFCLICIKADIQNCISRTHIGTTVLTVPSFISVFWLVWEIRISLIFLTMKHISIWTDVHLNFMHSAVVVFYPERRHCPVQFEWSPLVMSTAQTIPPIVTQTS